MMLSGLWRALTIVILLGLLAACAGRGAGTPGTVTPEETPSLTPVDKTPTRVGVGDPAGTPATPPVIATPATPTPPVAGLVSGDHASIVNTDNEPLRLRSAPGTDAPILALMPPGTVLTVTGEAQIKADALWYPVDFNGLQGWVLGMHLARVAPTATPRPPIPTNGPLATRRLVTFYGHPASDRMGVLGEFDDPVKMVAKLKEQTAAYTAADPSRPAQCTIELIASVAQGQPGPQGLYILRTAPDVIEGYAQLAEQNGCLLMLDVQMGYDTVMNDVAPLVPFLKRPYVHLAIDPEFHVKPGQIPGEHYGSVSAADVTQVGELLGTIVRENKLPDKVLILHQFRDDMLPDKEKIHPMPNVELVVMMDGWGAPQAKIGNYNYYIKEQLIQFGGMKLFYRQDDPLLTPAEVLRLDPKPLVIIYQ